MVSLFARERTENFWMHGLEATQGDASWITITVRYRSRPG